MAFCKECGNDIETSKFCSVCGTPNNESKSNHNTQDRDITKAIIHLKALSNNISSVIMPDDIEVYTKALNKISEEKFKSFTTNLRIFKKVKDINKHLEISDDITKKMLDRGKVKDLQKGKSKDLNLTKIGVIFVIAVSVVGLIIKTNSNPRSIEEIKAESEKKMQIREKNREINERIKKIENDKQLSACIKKEKQFIINKMKQMNRDVTSIENLAPRKYFVQYIDWRTGTGESGSEVLDYSMLPCNK